jgi:hypothetical protein
MAHGELTLEGSSPGRLPFQIAMLASVRRTPAKLGLIVAMIVCAQVLWVGSPMLWLWIGSQMTSSQQGRMGPYFVIAIGILASTVAIAVALARLQRLYERVSGREALVRVRLPWLRSLRDERSTTEVTVLDLILVATAVGALVVLGLWFLFFAGSPLPG